MDAQFRFILVVNFLLIFIISQTATYVGKPMKSQYLYPTMLEENKATNFDELRRNMESDQRKEAPKKNKTGTSKSTDTDTDTGSYLESPGNLLLLPVIMHEAARLFHIFF
ncbi:UNVERIFIED_CONTAM: hypothetical protein RMT77_016170 [Armadillidium vulgare]